MHTQIHTHNTHTDTDTQNTQHTQRHTQRETHTHTERERLVWEVKQGSRIVAFYVRLPAVDHLLPYWCWCWFSAAVIVVVVVAVDDNIAVFVAANAVLHGRWLRQQSDTNNKLTMTTTASIAIIANERFSNDIWDILDNRCWRHAEVEEEMVRVRVMMAAGWTLNWEDKSLSSRNRRNNDNCPNKRHLKIEWFQEIINDIVVVIIIIIIEG